MEYKVVYANSLSLCLLFSIVLCFVHSRYWEKKNASNLIWAYILMMTSLLTDIIWIFIDGNSKFNVLNYILNIIEFNTFGWIAYNWLCYCLDYFLLNAKQKKIVRFSGLALMIAISVLIGITPWTEWVFKIDGNGVYTRGKFFFIQQVGYVYSVFCSILAIITCRKTPLTRKKDHLKVIVIFPIPTIALGLLQLILPPGTLPTLQTAVFISMFLIFSKEQGQRITVDGLTGLVNRYEFERILGEEMIRYKNRKSRKLFAMFFDIDHFKIVNDTYGHLEGDKDLKFVANVLENCSEPYNATVGHLSGDEFGVLLENVSEDDITDLIACINTRLEDFSRASHYSLTVSCGVAEYDGEMNILQLINTADRNMYSMKKEKAVSVSGKQ